MVHILRTVENGNIRNNFPCLHRKTRWDEPRLILIGAVVPEIQPHLGGKGMTNGAGGLGVRAKRVSDRGLVILFLAVVWPWCRIQFESCPPTRLATCNLIR